MRRVYDRVTVVERDGGFAVLLDGRPVKTPAARPLVAPQRALAEAVAEEWRAQGPEVRPATMPMTRLAATAIDHVAPRREAAIDEIAAYAGTDLLCYRADAPADLARRQQAAWQPLLEWAEARYGVRFAVVCGVLPEPQPDATLAVLRRAVAAYDPFALAALHLATACCGSVVLALALAAARLDSDAAWAASQLDESFQIERWGEDHEARARREALRADIQAAARFLALCHG